MTPRRRETNNQTDTLAAKMFMPHPNLGDEVNGKIVEKVESVFMDPTDYSFIK